MRTPPILPPILFKFPCSFYYLVSLRECVIAPHLMSYFTLYDGLAELWNLTAGETLQCVYALWHHIWCKIDTDGLTFTGTLIWYQTHKQIYTQHIQGPIHWNINIYYTNCLVLQLLVSQYPDFSKINHLQKSRVC